jgi:membrane protein required for colicin V production
MNWLDIVIIVVVFIGAFIGLWKGLISIVASLVGLIVGIILAGHFYDDLAPHLTLIPNEVLANIVAFLIILLGVMIVATIIAHLLKVAISAIMLGWINRIGGAIFGVVLALLMCSAVLAIWANFIGTDGAISESLLARVLLDYFPFVLALLPDEFDGISSIFGPV